MDIALIGVSHWHAEMHAQAAQRAGARLSSSWDPDPGCNLKFAEKFDCQAASSFSEAIASAGLAVVMGKPDEIAKRGLAVIDAGVPLLVEKPIGTSAAAIAPLIDAARHKHAFAALALPHELGMMAALGNLSAAGRLGPISHSHFRLINGPPQRYINDGVAWVLDRKTGGGGALRNLGIHGVSAFLALAGDQVVSIVSASFGRPIHGTEVEDYAAVVLHAEDDLLGVVEAGYTFASMKHGLFEWRVSARNATLCDFGDRLALSTLDDEGQRDLPVTPPARRYDDVMADTLQRLAAGRPPAVSLFDCQRAMAVIDRCYEISRV